MTISTPILLSKIYQAKPINFSTNSSHTTPVYWKSLYSKVTTYLHLTNAIYSSTQHTIPKVCVVGSGPAGFYATQQIIKAVPAVQVDILERLPVPFGLVRYGVAPDHPEVKNVINTFTKTAQSPQVKFVGNVCLGKDISLEDLMQSYHAVLLAYGADADRKLDIPGENLSNVLSAREFVGWYNGLPSCKDLSVNLDTEVAVVVGQGNVALDVARILLTPVDKLKLTDITEHALSALSTSRVRHVRVIGRRGPMQVAFTIKEFREMLNLPGCKTIMDPTCFTGIPDKIPGLERPRRRLTELICKSALEIQLQQGNSDHVFELMFLRSPRAFAGGGNGGHVKSVELAVNELIDGGHKAQPTSKTETIECGLVLRSVGYYSTSADSGIPFDDKRGHIQNISGFVKSGLYAAGWVGSGPVGVILSTMNNAFAVGKKIADDLAQAKDETKPGFSAVQEIIREKGIQTVSFAGWEAIDKEEKRRGAKHGKPREKILSVREMLEIAEKYTT
ncbi:NADPH:adrenodoxin oxidoreductase, mitochondrial isoform X1 [Schistocerca piceifrons]|uniref:NADPH:adrenodoxin oxidoreductase, mitochondrial isoform X1 n=1 Tax=Schistocerca piceifrons TaxID=274613 RepID=UPI001F5EA411|nr:NADPH:adrenodoxin oxidoreductase, mitochondrial isoform X1 [Schistocerca piceifrons]